MPRDGSPSSVWQALLDPGAASGPPGTIDRAGATTAKHAVDLARRIGRSRRPSAHSLNRLGNWQANAGQAEDGIRNHLEALRVFEEANDVHGRAVTLDLLAIGCRLSGDTATALDHYAMAIPLLRSIGDRRTLSSALSTAGRNFARDGSDPKRKVA